MFLVSLSDEIKERTLSYRFWEKNRRSALESVENLGHSTSQRHWLSTPNLNRLPASSGSLHLLILGHHVGLHCQLTQIICRFKKLLKLLNKKIDLLKKSESDLRLGFFILHFRKSPGTERTHWNLTFDKLLSFNKLAPSWISSKFKL